MLKLLFQDVKDRLSGNKAKANARLGLVSAPEGTGRVIWLVADHSHDSVLMAAGLMAAISEKRKDVRLVLTYETEYRDVLVRHLNGLKKMGFGYGVGDNKLAARQIIKRLSPFAVIFVGHQPHKTLLNTLAKRDDIHKIAFQFLPDNPALFEACYPDINPVATLKAETYYSPVFSVLTRLVQTQIDKQLGAMLCGEKIDALFHLHGLSSKNIQSLIKNWEKTDFSQKSLLALSLPFSSNEALDVEKKIIAAIVKKCGYIPVFLSQWNQAPLTAKTIVIADENKWYAALCTAAVGTHLLSSDRTHFWQAVSSGSVVSVDNEVKVNIPALDNVLKKTKSYLPIFPYWSTLIASPTVQRKASDALRKAFWNERREAEKQVNELLQRVYDW